MWFTANVVSRPSSVSTRWSRMSPALLTSTSTRGSAAVSRAASARTARCEPRSATKRATSPPLRWRISASARSPLSRVRQTMATRAPAAASATAVSLPIPAVVPVTTQVLPFMAPTVLRLEDRRPSRAPRRAARPTPRSFRADLGQQPLGGRLVSHDPVGHVARLALVEHTLELLPRLGVAPLFDQAPAELDARAGEVRVEGERFSQVTLGPRHVASEHRGRLEVERPRQRQPRDVVGVELEDRVDLLPQRRQEKGGVELALRDGPAAEVRGVPEMRFRVARRHVDRPLGDVSAALVARELGLDAGRPVVGPEQMSPGQEEQGVQARLARHLGLEQIARAVDAHEVLVEGGHVLP